MKIAVLGGGFTGLAASFYLQKKGHQVTLYEKEEKLGGLASGFKEKEWQWYLDRTYHHIFSNDTEIINFSHEIDFKDLSFYEPITASLYKELNNYRIITVDSPQDFLKIPFLSMPEKLRSSLVLAFLKFGPYLNNYEKISANEFLRKTMGERAWNVLWDELFRKKFGKYAENILASFIWARIKKRTKKLGYPNGGFQFLINHIESKIESIGVLVKKGENISGLTVKKQKLIVNNQSYDIVLSTLPTPVFISIASDIFPDEYKERLLKIKYLHAINYVFESETPVLEKTYWLNINVSEIPFMVFIQHTNLVNKKYYGNSNISYIGRYVDFNDPIIKLDKNQIKKLWIPYLENITGKKIKIKRDYLNKAANAQPIFDKDFVKNKPDFITPIKNLYCANLDMTYPYDRGTNYAVKLGKEISEIINR